MSIAMISVHAYGRDHAHSFKGTSLLKICFAQWVEEIRIKTELWIKKKIPVLIES